MNTLNTKAKLIFKTLTIPKTIIFGVALFQFVWMLAYVIRFAIEFPTPVDHWNPILIMQIPAVVLFAALMLLIGGPWKYLFAIVSSMLVVYRLGYGGLIGVASAHDLPIFSLEVSKKWLMLMYELQPQYILQIVLSAIIIIYAAYMLLRRSPTRLA